MAHTVRLQQLPEGLQFPAELKDRIRFDGAKGRLVFRGFMTKAEYDRLARLHHDYEYQRALAQLFQVSTEEDGVRARRLGRALAVCVALCLVLAGVAGAVWWQLAGDPPHANNDDKATRRVERVADTGSLDARLRDARTPHEVSSASPENN